MTANPIDLSELEAAVSEVYRGTLEEFIDRRDALAKQLRASKLRDEAERVKALRKPSRTAWALDQVVFEDSASVERLAAAIREAQNTHTDAASARAAQEGVRAAMRAVAEAGARAAIRGRSPIESGVLVTAMRAVIGDADAFAAFCAGRLTEVPEGGGLDLLAAMSVGAAPPAAARGSAPSPAKQPALPAKRDKEEQAAARAELERAQASLTKLRARAQAAERAVLAAEEQLERARQDVDAATIAVREAEQSVAELRARGGSA